MALVTVSSANSGSQLLLIDRKQMGDRLKKGISDIALRATTKRMEAPMKHNPLLLVLLFGAYACGATEVPSGPALGTVAPDFKVHNLVTGEDVTLSSQQGKVVILTFWASWCGPCKRELPILENAQRAVGKDKLVVFAVSHRDKPEAIAAIKKAAANWQINVMTDRNDHVARLYAVSAIPHLFMIGRDGKVVANHLGYGDRTIDELIADINGALAAPQSREPET
jgi:thiol-disulfide isomerase/thioredoxin